MAHEITDVILVEVEGDYATVDRFLAWLKREDIYSLNSSVGMGNYRGVFEAKHKGDIVEFLAQAERGPCTRWDASECPVHGNCHCNSYFSLNPDCPLHGRTSKHCPEQHPSKVIQREKDQRPSPTMVGSAIIQREKEARDGA